MDDLDLEFDMDIDTMFAPLRSRVPPRRGNGDLASQVERLAGIPLLCQPGSEWNYSVSIDVLGRLVEVWSGMSLAEFFESRLFEPLDIFHPNSRPALKGALCFGPRLPPAIAPTELVLLGYYLVSLQDAALDEHDPDGVLNPMACEFFRCHPRYLPLTRAGLFDPWTPQELDHVRDS